MKSKTHKKYKIGYTQGAFDMFHVGHLNLIKNAIKDCEYLIVGINSDALIKEYKNKVPVISEENRKEIVQNIKGVNEVIITNTLDKVFMLEELKFEVIFIGDDWKGNTRWIETESVLKKMDVEVVFLPYTVGISSTDLRTFVYNENIESQEISINKI